MKAQFLILFSTIITWYVKGTLWMNWAIVKHSFESNEIARNDFLIFFQKNKSTLINIIFIPLALVVICPFILVLVHPDTVPMGMLYLTVLIDILLVYFVYKFFIPVIFHLKQEDTLNEKLKNLSKTLLQINLILTFVGICWMYMLWKTIVS